MLKEKEAMVENSVKAINAFCRVMELHTKNIAQGGPSILTKGTPMCRAVDAAQEGLAREVEFLSFLRAGNKGKVSPED